MSGSSLYNKLASTQKDAIDKASMYSIINGALLAHKNYVPRNGSTDGGSREDWQFLFVRARRCLDKLTESVNCKELYGLLPEDAVHHVDYQRLYNLIKRHEFTHPKLVSHKTGNGKQRRLPYAKVIADCRNANRAANGSAKYVYPGRSVNDDNTLTVNCPKRGHGIFYVPVHEHRHGRGCPKCHPNAPRTTETFVKEARLLHTGYRGVPLYVYDKTEYVNNSTPVTITCSVHGDFFRTPNAHLSSGSGCPKCTGKKRDFKAGRKTFRLDSAAEMEVLRHLIQLHDLSPGKVKVKGDKDWQAVSYTYQGRIRRYWPDFVIPSLGLIVEVKSIATLGLVPSNMASNPISLFNKTVAKAKACDSKHAEFQLYLVVGSGANSKCVKLPRYWYKRPRRHLMMWLGM